MPKEYGMDDIDETFGAWRSNKDRRNPDAKAGNRPNTRTIEEIAGIDPTTIPDYVLENAVTVGRRLSKMVDPENPRRQIDLNDPKSIPPYLTVEQITGAINRANAWGEEYDNRFKDRNARKMILDSTKVVANKIPDAKIARQPVPA